MDPRRRLADAVFYQFRTGVQWRLLPGNLPIWTAVWRQFCRWRDSSVWYLIMERLLRRGAVRRSAETRIRRPPCSTPSRCPPAGSALANRSVSTAGNGSAGGNGTCSATSTACRSRSVSPAPNHTTRVAARPSWKPRSRGSRGLPRCSPTPPIPSRAEGHPGEDATAHPF